MERSIESKSLPKRTPSGIHVREAPSYLTELQQWLGAIILQPLKTPLNWTEESKNEAEGKIAPSKTMQPHERVEIYHQQYWWRLLNALHQNYPFVTRLFGYSSFNQEIGIPFLSACPPKEWQIAKIGLELPDWLKRHYKETDFELVYRAAQIDQKALVTFSIKGRPVVDFSQYDQEQTLQKKLFLQPHLFLFHLDCDLFTARESFLEKDVDFWNTHPFPTLEKKAAYFVLYRSLENQVRWKTLTFGEYRMLLSFSQGCTILEALDVLEREAHEEEAGMLPLWFRQWTMLKWFRED